MGLAWEPKGYPVEFLSLGGHGPRGPDPHVGHLVRPVLMSKVLGLNATQESSLGLVFHYADQRGLLLDDLKDLREVINTSTPTRARATSRSSAACPRRPPG